MKDSPAYHTTCPYCGYQHDRAEAPFEEGARPDNGDRVLCIKCGQFSVVDDSVLGVLRKPTKVEQRSIQRDPEATDVRKAWLHAQLDAQLQRRKRS